MASFQFPVNPPNDDVVENTDNGTKYIYKNPPGKWVVALKNPGEDFVSIDGDTMTGPLIIQPTDSQVQGALKVIPSSEAQNNRVARFYSTATKYFFEASANSKITYTGSEFTFFPSLNYFPGPGVAGLRIAGPIPTNSSPLSNVLDVYYNNDSSGTQIRYFGQIAGENDLVNKKYVDNQTGAAAAEESLIHGGTIAEGNEGSVSSTGNLSIQKSTSGKGGNLYIRKSADPGDGSSNVMAFSQSGQLTLTPPSAVGGGALNIVSPYVSDGSSNYTLKMRKIDNTGASLVFTQVNADTRLLQYKGPIEISPLSLDENDQPVVDGDGTVTLAKGTTFIKRRSGNGIRDFVILGSTTDNPTTADEVLFGTYRNTLTDASVEDAIAYFGRTEGDDNIQTKKSVLDLIDDNIDGLDNVRHGISFIGTSENSNYIAYPSSSAGDSLIITNSSSSPGTNVIAKFEDTGTTLTGGLRLDSPYFHTEALRGSRLIISNQDYIISKAASAGSYVSNTDLIKLNTVDLSIYDVKTAIYGKQAAAGLVLSDLYQQSDIADNQWPMYRPTYLTFSANSKGVSGIMATGSGAFQQFNIGMGYPTYSSGLKRMMILDPKNVLAYPDYSQSTLSDNNVVTIAYLKQKGLVTNATYTSSGSSLPPDPDDSSSPGTDTLSLTQTFVNIPATCEFDGRTDTGRGFTLQGATIDQPTNTSAVCLELYHPGNGTAAQLIYNGSTTADNQSVQTKESVNALISSANSNLSVLPTNWDFYNHNTTGTNSQLTGYWVVQWAANSETAIMIIKATNDSTNITSGTYVSNIPNAAKPASTLVIPLASRDGETTAMAVVSPTNGYIIIRNVQGAGNTRLEGQLVYSLKNE